jgi:hypothetical protein
VPPTLVRPTRHTLEGGRRSPRRRDGCLFRARPGPHHDVGPVKRVSSVAIGPVRPSPPSRRHPGHYSAIPDVVGARGDTTLPHPLLCPVRPPVSCTLKSAHEQQPNGRLLRRHSRSRSWTDIGHAMTPHQREDSPGRPSTPQHCAPYHHT